MYTYQEKSSADDIRTTTEKIVSHIGIVMTQDIANEILNRTQMVIPHPDYP